eukprot:scaffold6181_cov129-Isochrysis_galbana.AAC.2
MQRGVCALGRATATVCRGVLVCEWACAYSKALSPAFACALVLTHQSLKLQQLLLLSSPVKLHSPLIHLSSSSSSSCFKSNAQCCAVLHALHVPHSQAKKTTISHHLIIWTPGRHLAPGSGSESEALRCVAPWMFRRYLRRTYATYVGFFEPTRCVGA